MQAEEKPAQKNSILKRALITGFVGGLLSSLLAVFLYIFKFMEVAPKSYLLKPWTQASWTDAWEGHLVSVVLAGIVSILPAAFYYGLFRKINSMWIGAMFGVILWGILFLFIHPFISFSKSFSALSTDTIVTTLCLFILYGTFIGYSISYEYYDVKVKMAKQQKS